MIIFHEIIAPLVLAVYAFMQQPKLGKFPSGEPILIINTPLNKKNQEEKEMDFGANPYDPCKNI